MRKILYFIMAMLVVLLIETSVKAVPVTIDGKNWRQVTETTNISWNDLNDIYDISTGELDTMTADIGGVDFTGWTWASSEDVATMLSSYAGLAIGPNDEVSGSALAWADLILDDFDRTSFNSVYDFLDGSTRNIGSSGSGYGTYTILNSGSGSYVDSVYTGKNSLGTGHGTNSGVFLYQEVSSQPVPEPTTIALLGIGLVGLAGAEVRRRRKKKAVDKS